MSAERKRILSGMRATNPKLHLGNYEGALRNWVTLQDEGCEMYCMVADYHALTTMSAEPQDLAHNSREVAKDFIAGGIDPEKSAIFVQSQVHQHAELQLIFSMVTGLGKLERVPTFKEKKEDLAAGVSVSFGLLGYPVLQASDILLYKPYGVPVGKDQAAHLELTREIGRSFNSTFGTDVFDEIEYLIDDDELRSKLPGLDADDAGKLRKMSKSYDNCIYINESPDETAKKIKSAFTTPTKIKLTDPGVPEGCAVCQYLRLYSPDWEKQWSEDVDGLRGCSQNKKELTECINEFLRPMRERRAQIDDATIDGILSKGAEKASERAEITMQEVREAMRLTR
ncbi:MAG: tryptophan--tRNA ligase [Armatimonadetes bacterium]|nr:tryptophan--tRNA ligase [Armatimonadota bacterium]